MGEFDFGQFKEVYEYLAGKLAEGKALTPEEQKTYDGLISIANQGLNLTNEADFNSLYKAFNTLADAETKQKFEELYGTGLIQDPASGAIQFTRPGTLVAAMMRRGMSVRDGPIQALLSEGMRNFMDTTAKNSFAAMTNAYSAMTPIRGQNIEALSRAGNIASTAIGRRVPVVGPAIGAGRGGAGGAEGPGEGEPIRLPLPPGVGGNDPGFLEKIAPGILAALATGGMGILGGYLLKNRGKEEPKPPAPKGTELGPYRDERINPADLPNSSLYEPYRDERINPSQLPTAYAINQSAYQDMPTMPYQTDVTDPYASYLQPGVNTPWADANYMQPGAYYGMGEQAWTKEDRPGPAIYENYGWGGSDYYNPLGMENTPLPDYSQSWDTDYTFGDPGGGSSYYDGGQDTYDWGSNYDFGGGGGGDSYYYDVPSSNDWYTEAY